MGHKYPPVQIDGNSKLETDILSEIADFWKVPYSLDLDRDAKGIILSTKLPDNFNLSRSSALIVTPNGIASANNIARVLGLEVTIIHAVIRLPVSSKASVSIQTPLYNFSGPNLEVILKDDHYPILCKIRGSNVHILCVDLVSRYSAVLYDRLDEKPNWKFRIVTKLPFSYKIIPSTLRNKFFKTKSNMIYLKEEEQGPVECLRIIFLASLVNAGKIPVPTIGFWRPGKSYSLAVSHDVESQMGLEDGAGRLMEIENEVGLRSTWNIPSDRYPISSQLLTALAKNGEIGGHDTKHDGRLIFTGGQEQLQRVVQCKERLENLAKTSVRGFRAPLLQHSREMTETLGKAGYDYDSSIPNWEPLSPTSFSSHGIGTVFPLQLPGVLEIPVTMPQDHQLIRVGGLDVSEATSELLKVSRWIKEVRGVCILLIHPDYEFGEDRGLEEYRRLLHGFRSDPNCDIMTLRELASWWKKRQDAYIDSNGQVKSRSPSEDEKPDDFQIEQVTGYGPNGLEILPGTSSNLAEGPKSSENWA